MTEACDRLFITNTVKLVLITLLVVMFSYVVSIHAQERIAAIVNNDIISYSDVKNRLDLIINTSGLVNTHEIRQRLLPRVLQSLIDEHLKIQEAKALHFIISDQEVMSAINVIENQNNLPRGGFEKLIVERRIERTTAVEQIRAEIAWYKIVQRIIKPHVRVNDDEIGAAMQKLRDIAAYPIRSLLSEIFLPIDNLAQEEGTRVLAEYLIAHIKSVEDFQVLARQFSQATSATSGGRLGWVSPGQLEPEIATVLVDMKPGSLSRPIRTDLGYTILLIQEQKNVSITHLYEDTIFSLSQLVIPTDGPQAIPQEARSRLIEAAYNASSCATFETLASQTGSQQSGPIGRVRIGDLPRSIRDVLISLAPYKASIPITVDSTLVMVMICERFDPSLPGVPSRDEVASHLEGERIVFLRRHKLQDLRRAAFIEIRL